MSTPKNKEKYYYRLEDKKAISNLWILSKNLTGLYGTIEGGYDFNMQLWDTCKELIKEIEINILKKEVN